MKHLRLALLVTALSFGAWGVAAWMFLPPAPVPPKPDPIDAPAAPTPNPPEPVLEGIYHRDRWGAGRIGETLLPLDRLGDLSSLDGRRVRVRYDLPIYFWNQRHLDRVQKLDEIQILPGPLLRVQGESSRGKAEAHLPFELSVRVENLGEKPVELDGLLIQVRGKLLDDWWQSVPGAWEILHHYRAEEFTRLLEHRRIALPRARCAPGESLEFRVPFDAGLPSGEFEIGVAALLPGPRGGGIPIAEAWVRFDPIPCD